MKPRELLLVSVGLSTPYAGSTDYRDACYWHQRGCVGQRRQRFLDEMVACFAVKNEASMQRWDCAVV
jgi:hypothetical protein